MNSPLSTLVRLDNVNAMKLFDDSRPYVNSRESFPNPSKFAYCNSDWIWGDNSAVRDRCEQWFQHIPEGKKADLRGELPVYRRLRSMMGHSLSYFFTSCLQY